MRRGYKRATAHKLLRAIHCVHKSNTPYHDPETDYEALMVQTPRPALDRDAEEIPHRSGHRRNRTAHRRLNPSFTPTRTEDQLRAQRGGRPTSPKPPRHGA